MIPALVVAGLVIFLNRKLDLPPGPSIVLITIDTLRADRLGCYGYERKTSPNIDSLARRSALFETALTPRTKTAPAIASILTGLYPHTHGVRTNWTKLPEEIITLPEILKENGYRTAAVVGNFILKREHSGLDRGFEDYDDRMTEKELNRGFQEKTAGKVNEAVFAWLDKNHKRKFFLWVHYQDPHGPYTAPPRCRAAFSHREEEKIPAGEIRDYQRLPWVEEKAGLVDAASYRDGYDAEILYCDESIGKLLERLSGPGLEETVIVLAADHGESLGEHGYYFGHGEFVYEACSRVPLIIRAPSITEEPRRIKEQVNVMNIAPSILELAGLPVPTEMEGKSLLPSIEGEESAGDEYVFLERGNRIKGVRTDDWKYIADHDRSTAELYRLKDDPAETVNLISRNRAEAEELKDRLSGWLNAADRTPIGEDHYLELKEMEREALKSLGYL